MKTEYVVIDHEGNVSWNAAKEKGETFRNWTTAHKRATGLAETTPGETIRIYSLCAETIAPVQPVSTKRK